MRKALLTACAVILAAVFFASCASKGYPDTSTTITISSGCQFTPPTPSISAGFTVIWDNEDTTIHNISIAVPGGAISGPLQPKQTFPYKFSTKGSYPYTCTIHSKSGLITVN